MTFEAFRQWALDSSRGAALRWEDPYDDELQVLLAGDDYDAYHTIPVPPFYSNRERGHVHWLIGALPDVVNSRSLRRLAFRTSAWVSSDPNYADQPVDDPKRGERLVMNIAEKGRYEIWHAQISRSPSELPRLGDWELYATDKDGLGGALPNRIRDALSKRSGSRGPTMPAADMVLGSWDLPDDFIPHPKACGPLDHLRETAMSSYLALFRQELPGPVIASQAIVLPNAGHCDGYLGGAIQELNSTGNLEFDGPSLGDVSHYFEGKLDGDRLYRFTAVWRHADAFFEVAVAGPPGRFTRSDLDHYAAIQDKRARAAAVTRN